MNFTTKNKSRVTLLSKDNYQHFSYEVIRGSSFIYNFLKIIIHRHSEIFYYTPVCLSSYLVLFYFNTRENICDEEFGFIFEKSFYIINFESVLVDDYRCTNLCKVHTYQYKIFKYDPGFRFLSGYSELEFEILPRDANPYLKIELTEEELAELIRDRSPF